MPIENWKVQSEGGWPVVDCKITEGTLEKWVPILERERGRRLLQIYPVEIWNRTCMNRKTAEALFDQGTQANLDFLI